MLHISSCPAEVSNPAETLDSSAEGRTLVELQSPEEQQEAGAAAAAEGAAEPSHDVPKETASSSSPSSDSPVLVSGDVSLLVVPLLDTSRSC